MDALVKKEQNLDWKKTWKPEGIKIKKWGGIQPGAGRPKGVLNRKTLEQKTVAEEIRQRVLNSAHNLIDAQHNLALGCSFLYVVRNNKDGTNQRAEQVTDRETIEKFLAGELDNSDEGYFYITTEKPDNKAIDSLLDRTLGKAPVEVNIDINYESGDEINSRIAELEKEINRLREGVITVEAEEIGTGVEGAEAEQR